MTMSMTSSHFTKACPELAEGDKINHELCNTVQRNWRSLGTAEPLERSP
jgi:hypothetical protein